MYYTIALRRIRIHGRSHLYSFRPVPFSFIHFIYVSLFFVFSFSSILIRRRLTSEYQIWSDGDTAQRSRRRKRKRSELDGSRIFSNLLALHFCRRSWTEWLVIITRLDSTSDYIDETVQRAAHHYRRCRHRSHRRRRRCHCDWHDWWIGEWFYESIDLEMICGI